MKLIFEGWKRHAKFHVRSVQPVTLAQGTYYPGEVGDPLNWTSSSKAVGKLSGLALHGDFLVNFEFEHDELRNWLREFVRSDP